MTRKGRPSERRPPRGPGLGPVATNGETAPALIRDVRRCLRARQPLDLLMLASGILATKVDFDQLLPSLLEADLVETTALLIALDELGGDRPGFDRISEELARRRHPLPGWLDPLGLRVEHTAQMTDDLGDGEDVIVGFTTASGYEFTIVVYIDHNMGTIVKEAMVITEPIGRVLADMGSPQQVAKGLVVTDPGPAEARARITQAMANTDRFDLEITSEVWPVCRAMVEWATRQLPAGGRGFVRQTWSDDDLRRLVGRFLASPHAASLVVPDQTLLDPVLRFASMSGSGDPLRWSPVIVEVAMLQVFPALLALGPGTLFRLPDVLRALIPFAHAERGIRPEDTSETLAAIDRWEPDYRAVMRERWNAPLSPAEVIGSAAIGLAELSHMLGPEGAIETLDAFPLPDEGFDWSGVPADIHDRVADVLFRVDAFCDARLTVEHRTVCHRLLARAARVGSTFFRQGRVDTAAAALCWVVGQANSAFAPKRSGRGIMRVKDMLAWFGLTKGVSARGDALVRAAGIDDEIFIEHNGLGDPGLLISTERASLIELRDAYRTAIAEALKGPADSEEQP